MDRIISGRSLSPLISELSRFPNGLSILPTLKSILGPGILCTYVFFLVKHNLSFYYINCKIKNGDKIIPTINNKKIIKIFINFSQKFFFFWISNTAFYAIYYLLNFVIN